MRKLLPVNQPSPNVKAENPVGDLPKYTQEATPLPNTFNKYFLNELLPIQTQSQLSSTLSLFITFCKAFINI
ncbi:TPA: hypothetical protein ACJS0M_002075, partial [Streptococcus agalactiae]